MAQQRLDLAGKRFGRWTAIEIIGSNSHKQILWRCKCDCGNEGIVTACHLNRGDSKSCGCYQKDLAKEKFSLPEGVAGLNALYSTRKASAKQRGINFQLTKEEFSILTQKSCFYCGILPFQKTAHKTNTIYTYMGIDRIDNSKGYTSDNCVPCCKYCNVAKAQMSSEEFLSWVSRVYNNFVINSETKVELNHAKS